MNRLIYCPAEYLENSWWREIYTQEKRPPKKQSKSVGSTLRLYPKLERHPGWLLYMSDILLLRPNNVRLPDGRFLAGVFVLDLVRFTSVFWIDT